MVKEKFQLIWKREIKELNSIASFYRYKKNGAEILSIQNDDENKVFGITFRTPPKDSTGVAHILEHSVLCGSKKYPLKEPFVELLKGSMQTFLNALTFPDKTSYPVASQNEKDFYNLIDVYLDAVFNPLLTKEIFMQEGWHIEIDGHDLNKAKIVGVVYNEMKGAYSSPDSMLMEYSQQTLFPLTCYGFDSGGHPDEIVQLTYEDFVEFHRTYYHPSNSRIFFWGKDPEQKRLEILDEYLRNFDEIEVSSTIPMQNKFTRPKEFEFYYPASENSKPFITFNWLLEETSLLYINLGLQILEYLLINMDSSVLKKNLIESGLGEGLCGVGLEQDIRQMFFSTGLKGVKEENFQKVWKIINNSLEDIYKNNFDKKLVDAAINSFEFDLRELNTGNYPRGLIVMFRALSTWLYDEDPLLTLCFEKPLNLIKQNIAEGERIFEELVAKYFLNNQHRTTVKLIPKKELAKELVIQEQKRIEKVLSKVKDKKIIYQDLKKFKEYQKKQDKEEDIKKIPHIKLKDIDREEKEVPTTISNTEYGDVLYHDIETNNILYFDIAFDLKSVPQKYLGYANLIGRALTEMGTIKHDYVSLDKIIQAKTGGIHHETFISRNVTGNNVAYLIIRSKTLKDNIPDLFEILTEIFQYPSLNNKERFLQILMQEKAKLESMLIPAGHMVVSTRLGAKLDLSGWINEQIGGISYLLFLRYLIERTQNNFEDVLKDLEETFDCLYKSSTIIFNLTGSSEILTKADSHVSTFGREINSPKKYIHKMIYQNVKGNEAIVVPAQVNYVGKGVDLKETGYEFKGSHLVVTRYLRNTYIWDKIRVQGGAYGGFINLDRFSKILSFVSYRDPNCVNTLRVYDDTANYLNKLDITDTEIEKAIIGTISVIDAYKLPDAKGLQALMRYIVGEDQKIRQKIRDEVLSCTKGDFRAFAEFVGTIKDKGVIVILGDENKIKEAVESGITIQNIWNIME